MQIRYSDVLILEQFMRKDGTVLPQQLTGLCKKQQRRIERCVMQVHYSVKTVIVENATFSALICNSHDTKWLAANFAEKIYSFTGSLGWSFSRQDDCWFRSFGIQTIREVLFFFFRFTALKLYVRIVRFKRLY